MTPKAIFLATFLIVVACSLLAYFGQANTPVNQLTPVSDKPVPAERGPHPRAIVVGSMLHDFGTMEQGEKGEHVFTIRNEGEAPLQMAPGDHSCQCTVGSLGTDGLAPGKETTMTLRWEIKASAPTFQHYAKVRTNDPLNPELSFNVRGAVGRRFVFKPSAELDLGLLPDDKPVERLLTLHSELLESFDIKQIETSTPLILVETRPLTPDELTHLSQGPAHGDPHLAHESSLPAVNLPAGESPEGSKREQVEPGAAPVETKDVDATKREAMEHPDKPALAKCGYELKVRFQTGFPIGRFRETISVHTNVNSANVMTASFQGTRTGPIQIFATPGVGFAPELSVLRFKRFRAADGIKAKLMLFVNKSDQEFSITEATIDPPTLRYQLVKDQNSKGTGRDKFDLLLEIPPSETPVTLGSQNPGQILLKTNHFDASMVKMTFEYTSY